MTDGIQSGTSGNTGFRLGPWAVIALVSVPVAVVNATSILIEFERMKLEIHPAEPFFWEFSSTLILVLFAPLVGMAVRRWPFEGPGIWTSLAVHIGLTLPFALVHIFGIWAMRQGVYAMTGGDYDFFGSGFGLTILYEWRKDVITYAIFVGVFVAAYWLESRLAAAHIQLPPERIEVREGGRTLFFSPAEILYLEAAGNYVEIHTTTGVHFVRATLAAWQQTLSAAGFVRVHRSRLVNKTQIAAIEPNGSGDFELTLASGHKLAASRRYRAEFG